MMFVKRQHTLDWNRWLLLATAVLLLAAAFRLVALDAVPPGLAQDEVLDADIASFIRGGEHALFFRHGYGHEPLYHYWAVPFQSLLGENVLSIRLPSVYLGLLLVALTLRWARREFGTTAALVAGLGLAISWWPVIFSRLGIRPIMEPVLLLIAVWLWPLRAKAITRRGLLTAALAGLFLGLSIYTYTAARIILLIPVLFMAVLAVQYLWAGRGVIERAALRTGIVYAAVVLLAGGLVYLPLAVTLRANPDLQQRLEQLEGPLTALRAGDAGPVLEMTTATLGVFSLTGDPRWTYSLPGRPLFDPLTAVLFYGGLVVALWHWRRPRYALLLVWLFVALLPSALSPDAPSTVRLIGALPVVYLLPGLAVDAAAGRLKLNRSGDRRLQLIVFALLFVVLGINATRTIRDGFILWPRDLETRLRYQSALWDIGRHWLEHGGGRPPVVAEVFFEPIDADGLRRSIGRDPAARWIQTGAGVAGALIWPLGEPADLYVPEYAPLDAALAELAGLDPRPTFRSDTLPSFAVYVMPDAPAAELAPGGVEFGSGPIIRLTGLTAPIAEDDQIALASWWVVTGDLPEDAAIFVHLIAGDGAIVAQYDGLDAAAATLRPGDAFLQRHILKLPETMNEADYTLRMGIYRRADGQRIPLSDGSDALEIARCRSATGDSESLICSLTGFR